MKTGKRVNGWMIAVVAALMTGVAHAQTKKLIDPGTGAGDDIKNGGFESIGGTGTYRPYTDISDWFNYGGNAAVNVVGSDRKRTETFGGSVAKPLVGSGSLVTSCG